MTAKINTRNAAHKTPRRLAMAATLTFVAAALSACGGAGSGEQGAGNGQEEPRKVVERTVIVKEEAGGGSSAAGGQTEERDGTYAVGNGGEVEFVREGNSLRLVDVRSNPGWEPLVNDQGPEDIGVEFRRGNVEWQFDAEIEDGGVLVVDPADKDIEGPERFDD